MILITGSSGMIGTALCKELLKQGIEFIGVDKQYNKWDAEVNKRTIHLDLLDGHDLQVLTNTFKVIGVGTIIHLAANARVHNLIVDPSLAVDNVAMTDNVYQFARNVGCSRILLASSREVYGNILQSESGNLSEDKSNHLNCTNQYTASKLFGESLASAYATTDNIKSIIIRFSNVYGKYDTSDRFIPIVIQQVLNGKTVNIFGGKEKSMDFTYIDDAVSGVLTIYEKFDTIKNMEVFNISSGTPTSLYEIASQILDYFSGKLSVVGQICEAENRPGEPMHYAADITKIQELGYVPQTTISQGIVLSIKYYKEIYAS